MKLFQHVRVMGIVAVFCAIGLSSLCAADSNETVRPKVLATRLSSAQIDELERDIPEVQIVRVDNMPLEEALADVDGWIGAPTPETIVHARRLRWVQVTSAGVKRYMFPELVDSDIVLTNAKIVHGPEIAEHAMALLLTLTHHLHSATLGKQRRDWDEGRGVYDKNIVLYGKTALVIGLGGIGTGVAERAHAFGMDVLALDPKDIPFLNAVREVGKPDRLHEFLPQADVVFICAPHTPKTEGMIGAEEFALMKPGAYLINVSRGKIVRTEAMVEALASGRLAGAGMDVVDPEPLPKDHRLWEFDNFLITPHISGRSDKGGPREFELIKDNVRRFGRGLPLRNVVEKKKGY